MAMYMCAQLTNRYRFIRYDDSDCGKVAVIDCLCTTKRDIDCWW